MSPEAHTPPRQGWGGVWGGGYPTTPYLPGTPSPAEAGSSSQHPAAPRAVQERASGLNGPRGVRAAPGSGPPCGPSFPYLRSFWPGIPDGLRAIWGNRWIDPGPRGPRAPWMSVTWNVLDEGAEQPDPATSGAGSGVHTTDPAPYVAGSVCSCI